jgi:hypothetical protein
MRRVQLVRYLVVLIATVLLPIVQQAEAQATCTISSNKVCTTPAFAIPLLNVPTLSTVSMGASANFALIPAAGVTAADFANGFDDTVSPLRLTLQTNSAIKLKMYGSTSAFSGTGCGLTLADVKYATTVGGARTTAIGTSSASANTLLTQSSATSSTTVSLYFRVTLSWAADPPAPSCSLPLTFTLSP